MCETFGDSQPQESQGDFTGKFDAVVEEVTKDTGDKVTRSKSLLSHPSDDSEQPYYDELQDEIYGLKDTRSMLYKGTLFSDIFREGLTKSHSKSLRMKIKEKR